jgi:hypothetical protein
VIPSFVAGTGANAGSLAVGACDMHIPLQTLLAGPLSSRTMVASVKISALDAAGGPGYFGLGIWGNSPPAFDAIVYNEKSSVAPRQWYSGSESLRRTCYYDVSSAPNFAVDCKYPAETSTLISPVHRCSGDVPVHSNVALLDH